MAKKKKHIRLEPEVDNRSRRHGSAHCLEQIQQNKVDRAIGREH